MFGWEYPPHVFGGLATANFGISQGLHAQGDVETVLCLPHPFGDEDRSACRIWLLTACLSLGAMSTTTTSRNVLATSWIQIITIVCATISMPTSTICTSTTLAAWSSPAVTRLTCTRRSTTTQS